MSTEYFRHCRHRPWWSLELCESCCNHETCSDDGPSVAKRSKVLSPRVMYSSSGGGRKRRRKLFRLFANLLLPKCEYANAAKTWRMMMGSSILCPLRIRILGGDVTIKTTFRPQGFVDGRLTRALHDYRHHNNDSTYADIATTTVISLLSTDSENTRSFLHHDVRTIDWLGPYDLVAKPEVFACGLMSIGESRNVRLYSKLQRDDRELGRLVFWIDYEAAEDLFIRWRLRAQWLVQCRKCDWWDDDDGIFRHHNRKKPGRGQRGRRRRYTRRKAAEAAVAAESKRPGTVTLEI